MGGMRKSCPRSKLYSGEQYSRLTKHVGLSNRKLSCSGAEPADPRDKNRVEEVGLFLFEDCVLTAHHKKNGKWALRQSLFLDNVTVRYLPLTASEIPARLSPSPELKFPLVIEYRVYLPSSPKGLPAADTISLKVEKDLTTGDQKTGDLGGSGDQRKVEKEER